MNIFLTFITQLLCSDLESTLNQFDVSSSTVNTLGNNTGNSIGNTLGNNTGNTLTRKRIWLCAKAAVKFTSLKDSPLPEFPNDEILVGFRNLNIHTPRVLKRFISNIPDNPDPEEKNNPIGDSDSCSEDEVLENIPPSHYDLLGYLHRMSFRDIPKVIKNNSYNLDLTSLCSKIFYMGQEDLAAFFQACFILTHNHHFPYILLKSIVQVTLNTPSYNFLDGSAGWGKLVSLLNNSKIPVYFKESILKILDWCQNEDTERSHATFSIIKNSLRVTISNSNKATINKILDHLQSKLCGYPLIKSITIRNTVFYGSLPHIYYITRPITRKLIQLQFDKCSFPGQVFNLVGDRPLDLLATELLGNLKHLNLTMCKVEHIDCSILLATSLTVLVMSPFRLYVIPSVILNMTSLKILKLSNGRLTSESIPSEIKNLTSLEILGLHNNNLSTIPEPITEMGHLKKLIISANDIEKMPEDMSKMKHLEELVLDGNSLSLELGEGNSSGSVKGNNSGSVKGNSTGSVKGNSNDTTNINITQADTTNINISQINPPSVNTNFTAPPAIKSILIRKSKLPRIPSFVLKMNSLTRILLSHNKIQSIDDDFALLLPNIKVLVLHANLLTEVPRVIEDIKQLEMLSLSGNLLTCETTDVSLSLPKTLKYLKMYKNVDLKKIPTWVFDLENLIDMNFVFCGLTSIPSEIEKLKRLQSLKLTSNQLTALPEEIFSLVNLKCLDFSQNKGIETIPASISNLVNLERLFGHNCSINQPISSWIGDLVNLRSLDLGKNFIPNIDRRIGCLTKLEELRMDCNRIVGLSDGIKHLRSLKVLSVMHNQISLIPDWIGDLRSLIMLNIGKNTCISEIPSTIGNLHRLKRFCAVELINVNWHQVPIFSLYGLQELDLSKNRICHVSAEICALRSLKSINFSFCMLQEFPTVIYSLPCVESLLINTNNITVIPEGISRLKRLLKLFDISSNSLTKLPDDIIELRYGISLNIANNQFSNKYLPTLNKLRDHIGSFKFTVTFDQDSDSGNADNENITEINNEYQERINNTCIYSPEPLNNKEVFQPVPIPYQPTTVSYQPAPVACPPPNIVYQPVSVAYPSSNIAYQPVSVVYTPPNIVYQPAPYPMSYYIVYKPNPIPYQQGGILAPLPPPIN